MSLELTHPRSVLLLTLALVLAACSDAPESTSPATACELAAGAAVHACVTGASLATRTCYLETGGACPDDDAAIRDPLDAVATSVDAGCASDAAVREAGYGPFFTKATLIDRLRSACVAETRALAARSFGGPQGAALANADEAGRACLSTAALRAANTLSAGVVARNLCLAAVRDGDGCDAATVENAIAQGKTGVTEELDQSCPDLAGLIAIDAAALLDRTDLQAQCLTAIAHPDIAPLDVACGPRDDVPAVPRGEWTQVVLDESVFGTRCGDGSPYAFQLRLAPEGFDVSKVVVGMEGGGVCVFESDCDGVNPDLFEALSDPPFEFGPLSSDPSFSPFGNWTKVFLPYCTQDVFIGGGATSNFPSITVHRFGSVNTRASLQYVRDVIWRVLDGETEGGYRADSMRVLFGGFSAGGFGTLYNYHYVLDDLQWRHTAAYPDAALALDNGEALGVRGLGAIASSSTPPLGWGAMSFLPPYCFAIDCGVGPVMLEATAPRLKEVPEQQFLILSNQVDGVQVGTTFFATTADWINALRSDYCETRDLNGVNYYMPAIPESIHVISRQPELYADYPVDGVIMRDWLANAFGGTGAVQNQVVEGGLVEAYPGVNPFPCPVAE